MQFARPFLSLAAAATFAFGAAPAFADTIPLTSANIGQTYTLNYDGYSSGTAVSGLTSSTTFTLTGISGNNYTFDYSLTNTTSSPLTSRVSSFGFNTDPNIAGATSTGAFSYTTLNSNYPNGIGTIDVCFKDAATGSCAGGGSGGVTTGGTGTGTFTLAFSQPISALTLGSFYVRYQSITGAGNITSASGTGTLTSTGSTSGGTVPEPGVVGLLGSALIATAFLRRRKPKLASKMAIA
ncbi:MAG: cistern family PEP-CTERM protein [Sphingomonadales bacterium]|nr:cistern family PEP-CTERM protein [Sphingomonadales bacterium]